MATIPISELRSFVPVPTPGRFKGAIHFSDDAFAPLSDADIDAESMICAGQPESLHRVRSID